MSQRVLVTGGAGFIGSHLVDRLLDMDCQVVCLDDFNDYYDPALKRSNVAGQVGRPGYELVEGDVRDAGLLEELFARHRFDVVAHLAARAGVRASVSDPLLYQDVNCRGTLNLLEMCRRSGVERFVFSSTSSVYGELGKERFHVDDPPGPPLSPYAATKRYAELIAQSYHKLFGLKVTILRLFTVYGPRGRPDMSIRIFTDHILRGAPVPLFGDGSFLRDFTYVTDTVSGIAAALDRPFEFEVFNLAASHPVTVRHVIELIERAAGRKAQIRELPPAPGDLPRSFADIDKSTAMLGFRPEVSIEEGVGRFVEWFQADRPPNRLD